MMRLTVSTLVFFGALCVGAAAQMPATCPAEIGAADCWSGQDKNGAFYWAAKPKAWNGILVVHAHGGPRVGPIKQDDPVEDLVRFAVMVKAGYAWVGSSYRRGGYGVVMAAEDSDNARAIFVDKIAKPRLVIAHGQSWGGNVMAKLDETPTLAAHYNGVLLTSGVLGGGTRGYDFRIDLRAVYNYYCHNHPAPNEPAYALNIGLPPDSKLTRKDLEERVEQCTGVKLPVSQRSEAQQRALANILKVTRIPERTLQGHMNWATFLFHDIATHLTGGAGPFGNAKVRYTGSDDDAALNAGVVRMAPDTAGLAKLAADSDLTGAIALPTVTVHAIDDPTAFVEYENAYRDAVIKSGKGQLLVQNFADEHDHSFLTPPLYVAALAALVDWIDKKAKPSPQFIAASCPSFAKDFPGRCSFMPDYFPPPLASRVYPR